ncbi:MAG: hypothetical protein H6721_14560 [Sandaracinus sp.]|nr:hypothetical protein [Sandaracinus sp.]MCB9633338.1 hypothetical protein [Sandaracinus sp.]
MRHAKHGTNLRGLRRLLCAYVLRHAKHGTNLRGLRRLLYAYVLRHAMNRAVRRVRLASRTTALVR